jgi:Lar family restriction alleviation protein
MDKLKPCPFCGGEAETSHGFDKSAKEYFFVSCGMCNAKTMNFYKWWDSDNYESAAIEAWNRRV